MHDHEGNNSSPVVKQGLACNHVVQLVWASEVVEHGTHSHWIGRGQHTTQQQMNRDWQLRGGMAPFDAFQAEQPAIWSLLRLPVVIDSRVANVDTIDDSVLARATDNLLPCCTVDLNNALLREPKQCHCGQGSEQHGDSNARTGEQNRRKQHLPKYVEVHPTSVLEQQRWQEHEEDHVRVGLFPAHHGVGEDSCDAMILCPYSFRVAYLRRAH